MHGVNGDALGALKAQKFGEPSGFHLLACEIDCFDRRVDFCRALYDRPVRHRPI